MKLTNAFCLLLASFLAPALRAQTWERTFGGPGAELVSGLRPTPDGGFLFCGTTNSFAKGLPNRDAFIAKTAPNGTVEWLKRSGYGFDDFNYFAAPTADGGMVTSGYRSRFPNSLVLLTRYDAAGDTLWTREFGDQTYQTALAVHELPDGGFVVAAYKHSELVLHRADPLGKEIWTKTYPAPGASGLQNFDVVPTADGGFVQIGGQDALSDAASTFFLKTDNGGTQQWLKELPGLPGLTLLKAVPMPDGGFVAVGSRRENFKNYAFALRADANGDTLWTRRLDRGVAEGIALLADGNVAASGHFIDDNASQTNAGFWKIQAADGQVLLRKNYGSAQEENAGRLVEMPNGDFCMAGTTNFNGIGDWQTALLARPDVLLLRLDTAGNLAENHLTGRVFETASFDCYFSAFQGDRPLTGWVVEATDAGGLTRYASADSAGFYDFRLPPGTFQVRVRQPSAYWEITPGCPAPSIMTFAGAGETRLQDFIFREKTACPDLQVDVSLPLLVRCAENEFMVTFCNLGPAPAALPRLEIELDSFLTMAPGSQPWSAVSGRKFTLDLPPNFAPGACDTLIFKALLDCNTLAGQYHAVRARIFPDSICLPPDPIWDGASLQVTGRCDGDTARFEVKNRGASATSQSEFIIVIEDVVLGREAQIPPGLPPGGVFNVPVWAGTEGRTIRLEVEQSAGHPGQSRPEMTLEGCRQNTPDPFTLGTATSFPRDDADPFVAIEGRQSVDFPVAAVALEAFPNGVGSGHCIAQNTDIEYVARFQNTSADTLREFYLFDTLPAVLDPASVRPGASNVQYGLSTEVSGALRFAFAGPLLPGDWAFVKFRARQFPNVAVGTALENRAVWRVGFFESAATNAVGHTISATSWACVDSLVVLAAHISPGIFRAKAFPNPAAGEVVFELPDEHQDLDFQLFDLLGQRVARWPVSEKPFRWRAAGLAAGVYFFQFSSASGATASGRLVLR